MAGSNLFEVLKKKKQVAGINNQGKAANISFCLFFDEKGAFIELHND